MNYLNKCLKHHYGLQSILEYQVQFENNAINLRQMRRDGPLFKCSHYMYKGQTISHVCMESKRPHINTKIMMTAAVHIVIKCPPLFTE